MNADSFTKLFGTIITSSIWSEDDKTRIMWITLLACADSDGYCSGSIVGFAAMARMTLDQAQTAINRLEATDPHSRTPDHEGRRVLKVDGGWLLVNYSKYREKAQKEERREYLKLKKREQRSKCQQMSTAVNNVSTTPSASVSASVSVSPDGESEGAKADKEWQEVKALPGLNFSREVWLRLKQHYTKADFSKAVDECSLAWLAGDMDKQHFLNKLKKCLSVSENPQEGVKKGMSAKARYDMAFNACALALDGSDDIGHCLSILRDKWGKTPINGRDPVQDAYEIHKKGKQ
jgi:hypothetical protein